MFGINTPNVGEQFSKPSRSLILPRYTLCYVVGYVVVLRST
jgi:hypothetical protein